MYLILKSTYKKVGGFLYRSKCYNYPMKMFLRRIRHRIFLEKIEIFQGFSVLDTSCQDGSFLSCLREGKRDIKIFGVDINEENIQQAQASVEDAVFKVANSSLLPFSDNSFDVVISSLTLHHMDNPLASILEMKRVLKEGGKIYLIDIIAQNRFFHSILKYVRCPESYHFEKFYSLEEIQKLFSKTGLRIIKKKNVIIFPTFSIFTPVLILELIKKNN